MARRAELSTSHTASQGRTGTHRPAAAAEDGRPDPLKPSGMPPVYGGTRKWDSPGILLSMSGFMSPLRPGALAAIGVARVAG